MNEDLWPNWDDNPDEDDLEFEREGFEPAEVRFPMQDPSEVGSHYRSPGDDVNVVRVTNPDPPGCVRVGKGISVNGVSFRLGEVTAFVFGNEQSLKVIHKPEDLNRWQRDNIIPIEVHGSHQDSDGKWHEEHIGYVPKGLAKELEGVDLIVKLKTMFVPFQGKSPGVRMDLWKEDDLFSHNLDISQILPDTEHDRDEYAKTKAGLLEVVKNEQLEQLPSPPEMVRPIVKDSKHKPNWYPKDGWFGEEPF